MSSNESAVSKANNALIQAKTYLDRANKLKEQGILAESVTCYEKAIAIKPDYVQALIPLGEIHQKQKRWH